MGFKAATGILIFLSVLVSTSAILQLADPIPALSDIYDYLSVVPSAIAVQLGLQFTRDYRSLFLSGVVGWIAGFGLGTAYSAITNPYTIFNISFAFFVTGPVACALTMAVKLIRERRSETNRNS